MEIIEKLQQKLQSNMEQLSNNLDSDSFTDWKDHPVTKIFFDDIQLIMLDRMIEISTKQPIDQQATLCQAQDRGYFNCLTDFMEWNPLPEEEEE